MVFSEVRGGIVVSGLSAGPIPWPTTRHNRGRPFLILCGDLAEAVCRESAQAAAYWWGVSPQTVWQWRKALDVRAGNEGIRWLRHGYALEPAAEAAREKAQAKAADPSRRAKIAGAKRGKPRPRQVIEAMRAGRIGKPHGEEARRKMSEAHRRRGTRPPKAGRPWTAEEDELVRALPAAEVARRTGRTVAAIYGRRIVLGLPHGRRRQGPKA